MKVSHIALSERKILLRTIDVLLILLCMWLFSEKLFQNYIDFMTPSIFIWIVTFIFYLFLFGEIFQLYDLRVSSNPYRLIRSLFVTTFVVTIFYILTPFFSPSLPENRLQIIYLFGIIFFPVLLWRFLYMWVLFSPKYFKDIIIIGHSSKTISLLNVIKSNRTHNVVCYISEKEDEKYGNFYDVVKANIYKVVKKSVVNEVVISTSGFNSDVISKINQDIILLFEEGINIKSYESFYEEITDRVPKEYLDHNFYKNINLSSNSEKKLYQFFRRFFDVLISIIGLLIFAVFIPFVLILNLFFNKGPLFYTQKRVGQKGIEFKIFKLRSMIVDAEADGVRYTIKNDNRITPFGKFLRNTRLDEVPQFYNILRGDMSLIGPRPERPEFIKGLEEKIAFYAIRHVVKPGITGWAQVKYPYAGTIEEQEKKFRYDLFYIKEQSPYLDFKIIIKTITTVLLFRGQ